MSFLRNILQGDAESRELLASTSRNLIIIVIALYMTWHFIATLTWPRVFSPSLWLVTLAMLFITALVFHFLEKNYILAQIIWLGGLMAVILEAYVLYRQPAVLILLVFLPLNAIVTVGLQGTLLVELALIALMAWMPGLAFLPELPAGFSTGIIFGSIFTGFFGWGLSSNLVSAMDTASFHYQQARDLLEETRRHRAEISRMLKDRNQANYQLERLNEMLFYARMRAEEARADRDRFVLAVSHELRSPLNFILGFSDLMINSPEAYAPKDSWPAGLYDDVQEIYRSSKHLLGLINDILDLGQIDIHQMALYREAVNLESLIQDVQLMVEAAFAQKGLWLRVECEPGLPSVNVDAIRIRQVILNLVNNSLRFTETGGVTIGIGKTGDDIQLRVEDTGQGIAPEDIEKMFTEFRQVGVDPWRRREGSGLGLSISRRFVELHGGKIWVESTLGKGSCFYFTLPLTIPSDTIEPADQEKRESGSLALPYEFSEKKEHVLLLVTDEPNVARMTRQWLPGYQVVQIEDVKQLNAHMIQHLPQAIILDEDYISPQSLTLKDMPYDAPILGVVFPDSRSRRRDLPEGVSQYLVKPVDRKPLLETIERVSGSSASLLVVDDDPAMLRYVEQSLKVGVNGDGNSAQYHLLTALNGADALQRLSVPGIDVLLLDLDLPDMSGWDILAQVRQGMTRSKPEVIVISALDLPLVLFADSRVALEIWLKRGITSQEYEMIFKTLLDNLHLAYPNMEAIVSPKE
ncbi:MAG: response regulator [Anaerolineales bacterium]|nr:response regulator [Anaerolineales bacterium]